jgi:hypothetical protein
MKKPEVIVKCVANTYSAPNERIVEVSGERGAGCLISIRQHDNGELSVAVYRPERVAFTGFEGRIVRMNGEVV